MSVTDNRTSATPPDSRNGFTCFLCEETIEDDVYFDAGWPMHDRAFCKPCMRAFLKLKQRHRERLREEGDPSWWQVEARMPRHVRPCSCCGRGLAFTGYHRPRRTFCGYGCEREFDLARKRVKHEARPCVVCGEAFTPKRADAQFCSNACRQDAYRKRKQGAET